MCKVNYDRYVEERFFGLAALNGKLLSFVFCNLLISQSQEAQYASESPIKGANSWLMYKKLVAHPETFSGFF